MPSFLRFLSRLPNATLSSTCHVPKLLEAGRGSSLFRNMRIFFVHYFITHIKYIRNIFGEIYIDPMIVGGMDEYRLLRNVETYAPDIKIEK